MAKQSRMLSVPRDKCSDNEWIVHNVWMAYDDRTYVQTSFTAETCSQMIVKILQHLWLLSVLVHVKSQGALSHYITKKKYSFHHQTSWHKWCWPTVLYHYLFNKTRHSMRTCLPVKAARWSGVSPTSLTRLTSAPFYSEQPTHQVIEDMADKNWTELRSSKNVDDKCNQWRNLVCP